MTTYSIIIYFILSRKVLKNKNGEKVKTTYWIKAGFLFLSWVILFNGLDGSNVDSKIFFTSVLIYTGAVVFDLIFLCIETNAQVSKAIGNIFKLSIGLTIINAVICVIEFVGAMEGIELVITQSNILVMKIVPCGLTYIFPWLLNLECRIAYFMMAVLISGLLSVGPGLLLTRCRRLEQEAN